MTLLLISKETCCSMNVIHLVGEGNLYLAVSDIEVGHKNIIPSKHVRNDIKQISNKINSNKVIKNDNTDEIKNGSSKIYFIRI